MQRTGPRAADRAAIPGLPSPARLGWWLLGSVLVIAVALGTLRWLDWYGSFERHHAECEGRAVSEAAWFVWSPTAGDDEAAVAALEPGGEPLTGTWTHRVDRHHGTTSVRGVSVPTDALAPGVSSPSTLTWRGVSTGREHHVGDIAWREYARGGWPQDFEVLGRDTALIGSWRDGLRAPGTTKLDLRPDGAMHNDRGVECGRWAGRDRLLLLYFHPLLRRGWTTTLIRESPSARYADPSMLRYHVRDHRGAGLERPR